MEIAVLIIGLALLAAGIGFDVYTIRTYIKNPKQTSLPKTLEYYFLGSFAGVAIGGLVTELGIIMVNHWGLSAMEMVLALVGTALFLGANAVLWTTFVLKYWKKSPDEKEKRFTNIALFSSIPVILIGFLALGEGVADHLTYPLANAINFNNGIHLTSYLDSTSGFTIAWYGVIIVFGALVCYWIADHEFYKEFHKHGIIDSLLLVAFPGGIIGARIGYVIGNWNGDATTKWSATGEYIGGMKPFWMYCQEGQWWKLLAIWEGGLTILGGAVGGIIIGVAFMMIRRKYVNVRWAMDVIVPTILLAQGIGRWGNFFNHEVYGAETAMANWAFLPTWLRNQMATGFVAGSPAGTNMYVPLFLIEAIANIAGFFIIKYAIGKPLKKWLAKGDLCGFYLMWYGLTRVIMEPLRDPTYNMGSNGGWSNVWAVVYVGLGLAVIGFFHLYDYIKAKRHPATDAVAVEPVIAPKEEETKAEEIPSEEEGVDAPIGGENKE